ncbi:MAG: HAMP domain-containing histidine kinase [Oscillospiraceae bacterium]|nr:HAMP domain-containing histidine kinase [Oscillospiraceae bacterium]
MLKRLRLKFILINMTIVTIMLSLIFGLLYFSTSRGLERNSTQMMQRIARSPMQMAPPNRQEKEINLPYFSITVTPEGKNIETGGSFFDLSDSELLTELLSAADREPDHNGTLSSYHLRFLRAETPRGHRYVFADISSEQAVLHSLVETFALLGSAAFLVFLAISYFLARWAVKPVEKAWQQQKQFVADASHELKTPLTVIMTDAELLHAPGCSPEEHTQLSGSIITMAQQMRGLVESLLDLARLDAGTIKSAKTAVPLSEVASSAAMMFEPVFFEKGLSFTYEIEPDLVLTGYRAYLKQLVDILLDNAAKYASPGGKAQLSLRQLSPKKVQLCVENEGDPIPESDLKNLFKRFYRADPSRAQNHSYGLGLAIAQSITHEHHGRIRAESRNGWNRFIVELPR